MRTIRLSRILGLIGTAAVLGLLAATAGLGLAGWITGLAAGTAASVLLAAARRRSDEPEIHPADWVTLTRAVLIAGVAGLVADSFGRSVNVTALVSLSAVALVLDAVDGQVARRTGTATALGARIDGEVDAFLILLLSIIVSGDYGSWVLAIGAARYVLLMASWLVPWLAATLPPRYWRKVVAAVQGIVLTVAASGVLPHVIGTLALLVALALLAEWFGRDVIWLYRAGPGRGPARCWGRPSRWRPWCWSGATCWCRTSPGSSPRPRSSASRWRRWSWWPSGWSCRRWRGGSWPPSRAS